MAAQGEQLFDCLLHIELIQEDGRLTPKVKYQYPPGAKSNLQSIVQFCFPDVDFIRAESKMGSETFSFVLTETSGERRFGYCRRLLPKGSGKRYPECFCITSFFPCFSVFNSILDEVESRSRGPSFSAVTFFVQAILEQKFPEPGQTLTVSVCSWDKPGQVDDHSFLRPSDSDSMLDHVNLEPLISALDPHNLLLLFGSLLLERRVIFVSSQLSHLSACVQSAVALLYPFSWQHVYIPVLPLSLLSFCCAPMPFVVGVLESALVELSELPLDETLMVDLDENRFLRHPNQEYPEEDFERLDPFPLSMLIKTITECRPLCTNKKGKITPLHANMREKLTTSFLKFIISQIHQFEQYIQPGGDSFDKAAFIQSRPPDSAAFCKELVGSQMFEQFVQQTAVQRGLPRNSPIARWHQWYSSVLVARQCEEQTSRSMIMGITSSTPAEKVLKEGWAKRYTHKLSSESLRYYALTAGGLVYYASNNTAKGIKGTIALNAGTQVSICSKLDAAKPLIELKSPESLIYLEPMSEEASGSNDKLLDPMHQLTGHEALLSWFYFLKYYVEIQPTPRPPVDPNMSSTTTTIVSSVSLPAPDSPHRIRSTDSPRGISAHLGAQLVLPSMQLPKKSRELEVQLRAPSGKSGKMLKKGHSSSGFAEIQSGKRHSASPYAETPSSSTSKITPDGRGPLVTAQDLQKIRAAKDSFSRPSRPPIALAKEAPDFSRSIDRFPLKPVRPESPTSSRMSVPSMTPVNPPVIAPPIKPSFPLSKNSSSSPTISPTLSSPAHLGSPHHPSSPGSPTLPPKSSPFALAGAPSPSHSPPFSSSASSSSSPSSSSSSSSSLSSSPSPPPNSYSTSSSSSSSSSNHSGSTSSPMAAPSSPPIKPPKPIARVTLPASQTRSLGRDRPLPVRERAPAAAPAAEETKRPLPEKPKHATVSGAELMAASRPLPRLPGEGRSLPQRPGPKHGSLDAHPPPSSPDTHSVRALTSRFQ